METSTKADSRHRAGPISLSQQADDNLKFIRASMEGAETFTGVSGRGIVVAGASATIAAVLASAQSSETLWFLVWMAELIFAASVALYFTAQKTRLQGGSLGATNAKKLLFAFCPAMLAGAALSLAMFLEASMQWLPGVWLVLYGAAVTTAGVYSVRAIPVMGSLFLLLGVIVLLLPVPPDLGLGIGFGGLHLVFGIIIWSKHGG